MRLLRCAATYFTYMYSRRAEDAFIWFAQGKRTTTRTENEKKQSTQTSRAAAQPPSREYMYIQDCECALESQIHICDKTQFAVQASAQSGGGVARKVCYALFLNENRCIVYVYAVLWRTLVVQRQSNFVQGKRLNPAA